MAGDVVALVFHHEHVARGQPEEQLRRGIAREAGVERAREPAEAVRQDHRGDLVRARVVAERHRLRLVLADAGEHRAEGRAHDGAAKEIRAEQAAQHQEVIAVPRLEPVHAEGPRRARNARDAVGAAGEVAEAKQHRIAKLGEGEREHGERHTGGARANPRDRDRDQDGDTDGERDADEQRQLPVNQDQAGRIGAQAVGRGMPEREQAAIAHHEIEAHGEEAEDQRRDDHRQRVLRDHEGQRDPQQGDNSKTDHSSLPSNPPGRTMSTASIRRYMNASASSAK